MSENDKVEEKDYVLTEKVMEGLMGDERYKRFLEKFEGNVIRDENGIVIISKGTLYGTDDDVIIIRERNFEKLGKLMKEDAIEKGIED